MTASIELMRCGDVAIATNGVTWTVPRELPFVHDSFGQDDEWVAANFTNAMEIASAGGYPAWVDAQVGEGLTNGLYKLMVSLTNPPPEVINLTVGDLSVAVTNAGEHVFLLEKGTRYTIGLSHYMDGFSFDCDDGIEVATPRLLRGPVNSPAYSVLLTSSGDEGGVELVEPSPSGDGSVVYYPWLSLAPSEAVDPTFPLLLSVSVFDLPQGAYPTVEWQTNNLTIATGENFFWYGDEDVDAIDVVATCRDATLHGHYSIERHVRSSEITLSGGGLIIVEDAYTNAPGEVVSASSTSRRMDFSWSLAEEGTLSLESNSAALALTNEYGATFSLPYSWHGSMDEEDDWQLFASCADTTQTGHVGDFVFTFTPDAPTAATLTRTVGVDVVKIRVEAEADWPSNKVRHVFGPQETFRVVSSPQVSLSLDPVSLASVNGNVVTAPDIQCAFPVTATIGSASVSLPFSCISPLGVEAVTCAAFTAQDWATNKTARPTVGCVAVGMTLRNRLVPDYVSFSHLYFQASGCDATDRWGIFSNPANTLDPHDLTNGAWSEVSVGSENDLPADYVMANFDFIPYIAEDSGFQYNITNYWYIKIGNSPGAKRSFGVESQVYVLTTNGDLSVEKYGCVATRGTNDVTTVTRR